MWFLLCYNPCSIAIQDLDLVFVSLGATGDGVESLRVHKEKPTKGSSSIVRDKISNPYERSDRMFRITYKRRRNKKLNASGSTTKSASVEPMVGWDMHISIPSYSLFQSHFLVYLVWHSLYRHSQVLFYQVRNTIL